MSNVAPERMPEAPPATVMPSDPIEAQGIKAAEEAYARADAESDHVNKNQKYPDGMIPGYERISPAKPKAKAGKR